MYEFYWTKSYSIPNFVVDYEKRACVNFSKFSLYFKIKKPNVIWTGACCRRWTKFPDSFYNVKITLVIKVDQYIKKMKKATFL